MRALGLDAGGPRFGEGHACARRLFLRGARAVGGLARAARRGGGLFVNARAALPKTRQLSRERRERRGGAVALRRDGNTARLEPGDTLADRRFRGRGVGGGDAATLFLLPCRAQILVGPCRRRLALGHVVGETLDLLVDADDLRREIGTLIGRRAERRLVPAQCAPTKLVADRLVLVPLGSLIAERLDSRTDLAKDVVHADELDLGGPQAVQRFFAAELEPSRPGRLFDHRAPIRRTEREYLIDKALADHDERVVGEVRAGEEILKIAQTNARPVHKVFGFAVPEETPADLDLGEVDGQPPR